MPQPKTSEANTISDQVRLWLIANSQIKQIRAASTQLKVSATKPYQRARAQRCPVTEAE